MELLNTSCFEKFNEIYPIVYSKNLYLYSIGSFKKSMSAFTIHIKYGISIAGILIGYFLLAKLVNLHENTSLRLMNGVIMGYGLYRVIRRKKITEGGRFSYYKGFITGIYAGFLATLIFVGFMAIYMYYLDPGFPQKIMGCWQQNYYQDAGVLLFGIVVEGFASTIVLTLALCRKLRCLNTILPRFQKK